MKKQLERLVKSIDHPVFKRKGLNAELTNHLVNDLKKIINGENID